MMKLNVIIPDSHIPHEDKRAFRLLHKIMRYMEKEYGIHAIYILGDFADVYFAHQHGNKHPLLTNTVQAEIKAVNAELDKLDRLSPKAKKVFIEGNHEYRLERIILARCPELFGVTSLKHLLGMNTRKNWRWIDYSASQLVQISGSHLYARHEPLGPNAKATSQRAKVSLVYGHIHRAEEAHTVGVSGTSHVAFCPGWLGDKRQDLVFGYCRPEWQLGFATAWTCEKTGKFFHHKHLFIEQGKKLMAMIDGKVFTS